jgi:hypothetical protein
VPRVTESSRSPATPAARPSPPCPSPSRTPPPMLPSPPGPPSPQPSPLDHHRRRTARKGRESKEKEREKGGAAMTALLAAVRLLQSSISCVATVDAATDNRHSCVVSAVAARPPIPVLPTNSRERKQREG